MLTTAYSFRNTAENREKMKQLWVVWNATSTQHNENGAQCEIITAKATVRKRTARKEWGDVQIFYDFWKTTGSTEGRIQIVFK